jgi:hypothetical protein
MRGLCLARAIMFSLVFVLEEKAGMRIISPFFDAQDYVSNLEVA